MTGDDARVDASALTPDQRDKLRDMLNQKGAGDIITAIADIKAALAREGAANSTEARAQAQQAAIGARDDLLNAMGIDALEHRRAYAMATGMPAGSPVQADAWDEWLKGAGLKRTAATRDGLRMAFAGLALDSGRIFGAYHSSLIAETEKAHIAGRNGTLDDGVMPEATAKAIDEALLGAGHREKISGVSAGDTLHDNVKRRIGLEMGADARRRFGATGKLDKAFRLEWARRAKAIAAEFGILDKAGKPYTFTVESLRVMATKDPAMSEAYEAARKGDGYEFSPEPPPIGVPPRRR
jgi:hypothetical protein